LSCPAGLAADGDLACISTRDGQHVALGASLSKVYRESKTTDGHRAMWSRSARCRSSRSPQARSRVVPQAAAAVAARTFVDGVATCEVATFHIGRHWLGVKARDVVEAVDLGGLEPSAKQTADGLLAGHKLHEGAPVPVLWLARLLGIADAVADDQHFVIVRAAGRTLGLIAGTLGRFPGSHRPAC
jgi:hypothetical protein